MSSSLDNKDRRSSMFVIDINRISIGKNFPICSCNNLISIEGESRKMAIYFISLLPSFIKGINGSRIFSDEDCVLIKLDFLRIKRREFAKDLNTAPRSFAPQFDMVIGRSSDNNISILYH